MTTSSCRTYRHKVRTFVLYITICCDVLWCITLFLSSILPTFILLLLSSFLFPPLFFSPALHSSRDSKLGTQLKESTIRRIIVIVYSLFFFLPPLVYQPVDHSFVFGMKLLHSSATNTSVSTENKEAILRDVVDRFIQQYGPDSIAYLNVFPYQQTPVINRLDLLDTIRPEEFFKVSYSDLIGNVQYETSAIFSNHSMFLRQAGKEKNKCVCCYCVRIGVFLLYCYSDHDYGL